MKVNINRIYFFNGGKGVLALLLTAAFTLTACAGDLSPAAETSASSVPAVTQLAETAATSAVAVSATSEQTAAAPAYPGKLAVAVDGSSVYTILRAEMANENAIAAAVGLRNAVEELSGVKMKIGTDWLKRGEEPPSDTLEVLVGATNRPESAAVAAKLGKSGDDPKRNYIVAVEGKRVVLCGASDEALLDAVDYFVDTYVTSDGVLLPDDLFYEHVYSAEEDALPPLVITDDVTAAPVVIGAMKSSETRMFVVGIVESGSTVTVAGGVKEESCFCERSPFTIEIEVEKGIRKLSLTAKVEGKAASGETVYTLQRTVETDNTANYNVVLCGKNCMTMLRSTLDDYFGTNLMSEKALDTLRTQCESAIKKIREVSPDTELVYLITPNNMEVYPENLPDWALAAYKKADTNRTKQFEKLCEDIDGVTVVATAEYLRSKKGGEFPVFHNSDTHWNELGAYYGYELLMTHIAERFPAAAPVPLDEYEVKRVLSNGGNAVRRMQLNKPSFKEEVVVVRPKSGSSVLGKVKSDNIDDYEIYKPACESKIDDPSLPTCIMYRDSYSPYIMNFMSESFSYAKYMPIWEYKFSLETIKELQPDYIIIQSIDDSFTGRFWK